MASPTQLAILDQMGGRKPRYPNSIIQKFVNGCQRVPFRLGLNEGANTNFLFRQPTLRSILARYLENSKGRNEGNFIKIFKNSINKSNVDLVKFRLK